MCECMLHRPSVILKTSVFLRSDFVEEEDDETRMEAQAVCLCDGKTGMSVQGEMICVVF